MCIMDTYRLKTHMKYNRESLKQTKHEQPETNSGLFMIGVHPRIHPHGLPYDTIHPLLLVPDVQDTLDHVVEMLSSACHEMY